MAGPQTCNRGHVQSCFLWFIPSRSEFHSARYGSPGQGTRSNAAMLTLPPWVLPLSTMKTSYVKSPVRRRAQLFPEPLNPAPPSPSAPCSKCRVCRKTSAVGWGWGGWRPRERIISPPRRPAASLPATHSSGSTVLTGNLKCTVTPWLVGWPEEGHGNPL